MLMTMMKVSIYLGLDFDKRTRKTMKDFSIIEYLNNFILEQDEEEEEEQDVNAQNVSSVSGETQQAVSNMAPPRSNNRDLQAKQGQDGSPAQQARQVAPVKSPFADLIDAKIKNITFQQTAAGSEIKIYTYDYQIPFVLSISPNDVKLQKPPSSNGVDGEVVVLK